MNQLSPIVALLGRPDSPTDGLADYCYFLRSALERRGVELKIVRVPAIERGWTRALLQLRRISKDWRGQWVLLQYTALGWSRRGFPFGIVAAMIVLRLQQVRCGIVFHESFRQGDTSVTWIDHIRGRFQDGVIHTLHRLSARSVFTLPLGSITWLPKTDTKSVFVPLGANVPELPLDPGRVNRCNGSLRTVAVFCLSDPPHRQIELSDIFAALRNSAAAGINVRVVFLGRGTPEASLDINRVFEGTAIEVLNLGLQEAGEVSRILASSDAMLCVRGILNLRRASALAGIACGVPLVGFAGAAEGTPLAEAGVELVPRGDRQALGAALTRILTDDHHWSELRKKNFDVQRKYFSWDSVAREFVRALNQRIE